MSNATDLPATPAMNGELIHRVQQLRLDSQLGKGTGQRGGGSWLPWVLCGMMAVAWAGVGVRWYRAIENVAEAQPSKSGATPATSSASGSQTGARPETAEQGALLLQIKGTLVPFLQVNLSPDDVAGVVEDIYFKEGQRVKKGELLARIRPNRYENDLKGAEATLKSAECRLAELHPNSVRPIEVDQAKAELAEAEANRVRAKQDLERYTSQKASSVVSPQDIDKAVADLRAAEARVIRLQKTLDILVDGPRREKLQSAEADRVNAEARLEECRRLRRNCEVMAPIDGTILTKVADPGVVVSPTSFNVASGICTMADLSNMEAEVDVREDQIAQIRDGQRCEVAPIADPNRVYKGRVDRVMPIADDTKNTIKIRVKILLPEGEEPGSFLKPKMSAVVRVYNAQIPEFPQNAKGAPSAAPKPSAEKK